jgi:hypothetical protein
MGPKVSWAAKAARGLAMGTVNRSVRELYKQKRLTLLKDEQAEFVDKDGTKKILSLDELAADLWMKMDAQSSRMTNMPAFAALDINPADVKTAIIKEGK